MADEEGFLSLLIANERVGRALDVLRDPFQRIKCVWSLPFLTSAGKRQQRRQQQQQYSSSHGSSSVLLNDLLISRACRHQHAINQLQQDLQRGASYVEEVSNQQQQQQRLPATVPTRLACNAHF